jgi:wyosine [tRNA(Phe)-imidazoG37] synthetase (radical SAM superfamily)
VDRTVTPRVRDVDPARLRQELEEMVSDAASGRLFEDPAFSDVPESLRRINDIAFSGDGEPTTCPVFAECVQIAADVKRAANLNDVKIILITDACYLTRPAVEVGLRIMDEHSGEIWAKLDAGTESYYREVNRPNYPLRHVIDSIIAASRARPVVIQSLFMRLDGQAPSDLEIQAYIDRLKEITASRGRISYVQVYTVSRPPAQSFVTALSNEEVNRIAERVRVEAGLEAEVYYGSG